MPDCRC